jgi:hypothetical protein
VSQGDRCSAWAVRRISAGVTGELVTPSSKPTLSCRRNSSQTAFSVCTALADKVASELFIASFRPWSARILSLNSVPRIANPGQGRSTRETCDKARFSRFSKGNEFSKCSNLTLLGYFLPEETGLRSSIGEPLPKYPLLLPVRQDRY